MSDLSPQRRSDQLWLIPAEGQPQHALIAEVAVRARTFRTHSFAVPESLGDSLRPGVGVRVPHGRRGRITDGFCLRLSRGPWDSTRKPVLEVADSGIALHEPLVELGLWVAEYYVCPPGRVFDAILPVRVREPRRRRVAYLRATGAAPRRSPTAAQSAILAALACGERRRREVLRDSGASPEVLRRMIRAGAVELVEKLEAPAQVASPSIAVDPFRPDAADQFQLTPDQDCALEWLRKHGGAAAGFRVGLLFGVPGSGKTEVYVRAMRETIAAGRQALLLVPEIALVTQIVERLARRFERVAVLHGRMPPAVRAAQWRSIAAGEIDVVIGTRTAVFAPCPRLGLIVVDEEQEGSFKSLAAPYYHARDVAIKRGQIEDVPVLLGSATPALETWHNANTLSHFDLLRLPRRVPGAALPRTRLVDTHARELGQASPLLSPELVQRLRETLDGRQQAILLHNRRGYAVNLRCAACGLGVCCERCGACLVYHRGENRMKCHRCAAVSPAPQRCLDQTCGGPLERSGSGIQKLEEDLRRHFPTARLQRLDRDTMRRREEYAAALRRFEGGEADILIGTQMVAKGLDFPGVRLVGVLEADALLGLPDFRAAEQAFQLIVQVVGRAGRREGGSLALIQVSDARALVIQEALRMDYEAFARSEIELRKRIQYPPFGRLVRIVLSDARPGAAQRGAEKLSENLRRIAGRVHGGIHVFDAEVCVVRRLRDMQRWHVLVRLPREASAQRLLRAAEAERALFVQVQRQTIDVDPIEML